MIKAVFQPNHAEAVQAKPIRYTLELNGLAEKLHMPSCISIDTVAVEPHTVIPLYPGHVIAGPVYIETRLQSTAGQRAAWWTNTCGNMVNRSPYNPVIRGWFHQFQWWPPQTRRNVREWPHSDLPRDSHRICQYGSGVLNWEAHGPLVIEPVYDWPGLSRAHLRQLIPALLVATNPGPLPSSLTVREIPPSLCEDLETLVRGLEPNTQRLGDWFVTCGVLARHDNTALVRADAGATAWAVSPDRETVPLVVGGTPGWFLLTIKAPT